MSGAAFIYVYGKPGGAQPVKIGRSNAPSRRERELRHYLPSSILGGPDGVMLHTLRVPTAAIARQVERTAHLMLRDRRVHGSVNLYAYKHSSPLDWFHIDSREAAATIATAILDTLETAGISFIPESGGDLGARLRSSPA